MPGRTASGGELPCACQFLQIKQATSVWGTIQPSQLLPPLMRVDYSVDGHAYRRLNARALFPHCCAAQICINLAQLHAISSAASSSCMPCMLKETASLQRTGAAQTDKHRCARCAAVQDKCHSRQRGHEGCAARNTFNTTLLDPTFQASPQLCSFSLAASQKDQGYVSHCRARAVVCSKQGASLAAYTCLLPAYPGVVLLTPALRCA